MTTVNIYLNFNGDCEAAFRFYQQAFGTELGEISRFGEMPPQEGMPPLPEEMKNQVMHVSLPISTETMLMGSDVGNEYASQFKLGNNFSISINTDNRAEADRLFHALAAGGQITMPLADVFWGDYFGMLIDKFGVNWMVSYNEDTFKNA
mgnify:CR=1 FL=1